MAAEAPSSSSLFPLDAPETDSAFQVTARKFRPQTFGDMVGQAHVATTLGNAVRLNRLAHAYLFSGPRGVGKTTAARILAKAANCTASFDDRENGEPCRACPSCVDFEAGRSMNIIEIDAASNNGVDDVRELRDTVRIPPQGAKKKIYILDEIHMMSKGAFNALLKTLEEPPPYVLFIFATTEPHKVLPTILSRTQRFDFRRISLADIMSRLRAICKTESIEVDEESLILLARKADGALRDALSLLDQAVSLCGTPLEGAALREALGVVDIDLYFDVTDLAAAGDRAGLLNLVDRIVARGHDLSEFLGGLADHLRDLLVARSTSNGDLLEATEAERTRYLNAAKVFAESDLLHRLMIVDEALRNMRTSHHPRLAVELALLKLASVESAEDLDALIRNLNRAEATSSSGEPERTPAPGITAESTSTYTSLQANSALPTRALPQLGTPDPPTADEAANDDRDGGELMAFSPDPPPRPSPQPAISAQPLSPSMPAHQGVFGAPALRVQRDASGDGSNGAEAALALVNNVDVAPATGSTADLDLPFGSIKEMWPNLVDVIKADRIHVGTLLARSAPKRVARGRLEVAVPDKFSRTLLESEAPRFAMALSELLGEKSPPLLFVVDAEVNGAAADEVDPFERFKQLRHENPVIKALFEKFGAEIVW